MQILQLRGTGLKTGALTENTEQMGLIDLSESNSLRG
jgi:hypothetical protein